jgi:predicted alpha/beta superfamily hydrolase
MPLIDGKFRTDPQGCAIGLAGSSYGGLIVLYTALKYPDRIGGVLVESPSLHIGSGQLLRNARASRRWPSSVYLGVGTAEGETAEARESMLANVRQLAGIIRTHASKARFRLTVDQGAIHWFSAWKARLTQALRFVVEKHGPAACQLN